MISDILLLKIIAAAGLAFVIGLVLTPIVIILARKIGFVAKPRADRWHSKPTALMGGTAIFAAAGGSCLFVLSGTQTAMGVGLALLLIFLVGLYDDIWAMRPHYKLLGQVVAACFVLGSGIHFQTTASIFLVWPLTLLFIVGITNAMNLLDNMDGLAAGVALVSSLVLALGSYLSGNAVAGVGSAALAGAALSFLVFNFYPAKVFMGDCGSMFLGLALAVLAIQASTPARATLTGAVLLPSIALAIPIFDTTFVTIMRKANRRPISDGGCDHTSHRLVKLGFSERQAVLLLCGSSLLVGTAGIFSVRFQEPLLLLVGVLTSVGLLVLGRFLAQVNVYASAENPALESNKEPRVVLATERLYKRHFVTALIDALLAFAAFLIASLLQPHPVLSGASWAVASTAFAFAAAGIYRGEWHYLAFRDIVNLAVGSMFAGVITFLSLILTGREAGVLLEEAGVYTAALFVLVAGVRAVYLLAGRAVSIAMRQRLGNDRWVVVAEPDTSSELLSGIGGKQMAGEVITLSASGASPLKGRQLDALDDLDSLLAEVEPGAVILAGPEECERVKDACRRMGVRCILPHVSGGKP